MLNFSNLSSNEFLTAYWQKKPLLIRKALSDFKNHVSSNELAGLAMEEEVESRLIIQRPGESPHWVLKRGPLKTKDFKNLPRTHWTLLVQGVDRFIPEINALLDHFDFIPQWRFDDVMISYAVEEGSVGPHYDNYDVFLYQAQGSRRWLLSTIDCTEENYEPSLPLRIMKKFVVEQEYILQEGDMLYLPPNVGHHGISLSKDCMTYSFGYRSYQGQELWDSFGDYLSSNKLAPVYYKDPSWALLRTPSQIPEEACHRAKQVLQMMLEDEAAIQDWFGCFATRLDIQAESLLAEASETTIDIVHFKQRLLNSVGLIRNPLCRFAYFESSAKFYVNGYPWPINEASVDLLEQIASQRKLSKEELLVFLDEPANESILYELWKSQCFDFQSPG